MPASFLEFGRSKYVRTHPKEHFQRLWITCTDTAQQRFEGMVVVHGRPLPRCKRRIPLKSVTEKSRCKSVYTGTSSTSA